MFSAGYYPFDEHAPSDHCALWIDIDWERILGRFRPTKQQFVPRRLTMDNQKVVENYLQLAEAEYQRFNIPGRLAGLMSSVYTSFGLTGKQQRRFNRIHADAYTARSWLNGSAGNSRWVANLGPQNPKIYGIVSHFGGFCLRVDEIAV